MSDIQLYIASRTVCERLYAILYQAGFSGISTISSLREYALENTLIVYQRDRIPEMLRRMSDFAGNTLRRMIMLMDPDQYALYLDRARQLGITLLLMPVSPYMLLEALQEAEVIS